MVRAAAREGKRLELVIAGNCGENVVCAGRAVGIMNSELRMMNWAVVRERKGLELVIVRTCDGRVD